MLFTPEKKQKTSVLYSITSLPKEEKCAVCFDLDIVFINGEQAILPVKRVQCPTISFAYWVVPSVNSLDIKPVTT